jgi:hypothetical protein
VVVPPTLNTVFQRWGVRELVVPFTAVVMEAHLPLGVKQAAVAVAEELVVLVNQEPLIPMAVSDYLATSLAQLFSTAVVAAVLV